MPETYEEACQRAATSQGLDPIRQALEAEGFTTHVDQTGGFYMCLRVDSTLLEGGYVYITDDTPADTEEHEYIVCLYGPQDKETGYGQEPLREQWRIQQAQTRPVPRGAERDMNLARAKTAELGAYVVLLKKWAEGVDRD